MIPWQQSLLTSSCKRNHYICLAAIDSGELQRGDAAPELEGSCNCFINISLQHVWSVVQNPVNERQKELKANRSHVTGTRGIKVKCFNQLLQLFMCLKWFIFKIFLLHNR